MKTSISINEQDIAVAKFLEDNNIVYKSVYLLDCSKDSEWQHDLFNVSLIKGSKLINTEFKTGLGHRVLKAKRGTVTSLAAKYSKELKKANIEKGLHKVEGACFAVSPSAASVLHSLLLDSDCGHELFEDFCDNFGYDQDSIKSLEIYKACQKIAKQLNSLFTQKQIEDLRELLEDY